MLRKDFCGKDTKFLVSNLKRAISTLLFATGGIINLQGLNKREVHLWSDLQEISGGKDASSDMKKDKVEPSDLIVKGCDKQRQKLKEKFEKLEEEERLEELELQEKLDELNEEGLNEEGFSEELEYKKSVIVKEFEERPRPSPKRELYKDIDFCAVANDYEKVIIGPNEGNIKATTRHFHYR